MVKYTTKIATELFNLFENNKLTDILKDENGELMLVFSNDKCSRGLVLTDEGYTCELVKLEK